MPETEVQDVTEETVDTEEVVDNDTEASQDEAAEETTNEETVDIDKDDYNLLQLLKNPQTRAATINALLQHEGIQDTKPRTETKSSKSLAEDIRDLMGDDFDQVPAKLWPAIEKLLDTRVRQVEQRIEEREYQQAQKEAVEATERLYKKFDDVAKFEKDITALMQKYSPAKGQTQYEYLTDLYHLAKSKRQSIPSTQAKVNARIRQNAKEVQVTSKGVDERNIRNGSRKLVSAREAVELAMKGKRVE